MKKKLILLFSLLLFFSLVNVAYCPTDEIDDLFEALFFGEDGGWIGFIIICSIMLLVTMKVKLAAIPFTVVSLFMGIRMSGLLAVNNNLWWTCILYFIMPFFLLLLFMKKGSSGAL